MVGQTFRLFIVFLFSILALKSFELQQANTNHPKKNMKNENEKQEDEEKKNYKREISFQKTQIRIQSNYALLLAISQRSFIGKADCGERIRKLSSKCITLLNSYEVMAKSLNRF